MEYQVFETIEQLSTNIVDKLSNIIRLKPDSVICVAGGETPLPVMKKMVAYQESGEIDFSKAQFISLDEWVGLGRETKGSCIQTLEDNLFKPLKLKKDQIHFFDGLSKNLSSEIEKMDRFVAKYGIDFILLGIGMNGHIGFNEPEVAINSDSLVVDLDNVTTAVMGKYFEKQLPLTQGISLGFRQILNAETIVVMATGKKKADIVKAIMETEPTVALPASIIKTAKKNAFFFVDEEATTNIN